MFFRFNSILAVAAIYTSTLLASSKCIQEPLPTNSFIFANVITNGQEDGCDSEARACCEVCYRWPYELKFRTGAIFFSNKSFKNHFGKRANFYELEADRYFSENLIGWGNLSWIAKGSKKDHVSRRHAKIGIATLSVGASIRHQVDQYFAVFLGVGPNISLTRISRRSIDGYKKGCKSSAGALFKSGIDCFINPGFFVEVFADYLYLPVKFKKKQSLNGVKTGLGIGVKF